MGLSPTLAATSAEPQEPLPDAVEQWLQWEEQANLAGFRRSTLPVEVDVAELPRELVTIEIQPEAPPSVLARFLRGDRVLFPKHPLNRDASVAFFDRPAAERWPCRYTSSRTLVAQVEPDAALFSLKLATDHAHPDFLQPEKTQLRQEAEVTLATVAMIDRIDRLLGPEPDLVLVREVLMLFARESETACVVRDLRRFQDGHHYLPALSLPWAGRWIARLHDESFESFWGRHWAAAVGRAKARLLVRYGLWYETPNPQNILIQLDRALRPTGALVFRDLGDSHNATDAPTCADVPWTVLSGELRPETRNSFWAFGEAGEASVDARTLDAWYAAHDRAYFRELATWFPSLAPADLGGGDTLEHWNRALRGPEGARAIAAAFPAPATRE